MSHVLYYSGVGKGPSTSPELLSTYSSMDTTIVSIQRQDHGFMEVVGVVT